MDNETLRLVLQVSGEKSIDDLRAKLGQVHDAGERAGKGVAGMGQSMLQTGRIVQDFSQGGIGGVLNNIEGLTQALGLGAGLAGAFTIVGVAAMVLRPQIQALIESFGAGKIKSEAEAMAELEKATGRTADQTERLNRYKKETAEIAKLSGPTAAQRTQQDAVGSAIVEAGGAEKLIADLVPGVLGKTGEYTDKKKMRDSLKLDFEKAAKEAAEGPDENKPWLFEQAGKAETRLKDADAAIKQMEDAARSQVRGTVVGAETSPLALDALMGMVDPSSELGGKLFDASPGGRAIGADQAESQRRLKKRASDEVEALNRQGGENEAAMREGQANEKRAEAEAKAAAAEEAKRKAEQDAAEKAAAGQFGGLGPQIQQALLGGRMQGGRPDVVDQFVRRDVEKTIRAAGVDPTLSVGASEELVGDAVKQLTGDVTNLQSQGLSLQEAMMQVMFGFQQQAQEMQRRQQEMWNALGRMRPQNQQGLMPNFDPWPG